MECKCKKCVDGCSFAPGWFKPGEAEKAAELLGLSMKAFFKRHLIVDYWCGDNKTDWVTVFVLKPNIVGYKPGDMCPANPMGRCSFLTSENLCAIHTAKPFECKEVMACQKQEHNFHAEVQDAWNNKGAQAQITSLLGREPTTANLMEMLRSMRGER